MFPRRTVVILVASLLYAMPCLAQYVITDLGEFIPTDVNRDGQVIGTSAGRPARYADGVIVPMQDLGAGGKPLHWSQDDPRVSVGYVSLRSGVPVAAQWDASGALTLLYTRDQAFSSLANAQNSRGATGGSAGRFDHTINTSVSSAARWDAPTTVAVLDTVDGSWSQAVGIDAKSRVWGTDGAHPVVWDVHGTKTILKGQEQWRWISLAAVNAYGRAVGGGWQLTTDVFVPLQVTLSQGFTALPSLPGVQCHPVAINRAGVSIGNCYTPATGTHVPVQWAHGAMTPLPITVPAGVQSFVVTGMNDHGVLVGQGFVVSSQSSHTEGFLLVPQATVAQR